MNDFSKIIGNNIKEIRKKAKITQTELASLINVDPKYISRLETGSSTPSIQIIVKLSHVLKTEVKDFFSIDSSLQKKNVIDIIISKLNKANLKELNAILEITNCIVD